MSETTGAVAWRLASVIGEVCNGSTVGWACSVRSGTTEVAAISDGWSRAPWESTGGTPMTPDTPVHIASMSKIVTSLAIYQMINQWNAAVEGKVWTPGGLYPPCCTTPVWSNVISSSPPAPTTAMPGPLLALCQLARSKNFPLSTGTPVMLLLGNRVPAGPGVGTITLWDVMQFDTGIDIDIVAAWGNTPSGPATTWLWDAISATFEQGVKPGNTPGQAASAEGYHNQDYQILRGIIENCTGLTYDQYCQLYVWPLITGSSFSWPSRSTSIEVTHGGPLNIETFETYVYPSTAGTAPANQPQCWLSSPSTSCLTYPKPVPMPGWQRGGAPVPGGMQTDFRGQAGAYGWYASVRDITAMLQSVNQMLGPSVVSQIWADPALGQGIPGLEKTWGHNGGWNINGDMSAGWAFVTESGIAVSFIVNSDSVVADTLTPVVQALQPLMTVDPPQLNASLPSYSFPMSPVPVHASQGVQARNPFGFGSMLGTQTSALPTSSSPAVATTPQMLGSAELTVTCAVFDGTTQVSLAGQMQANGLTERPANSAPVTAGPGGATVATGPGLSWTLRQAPAGQNFQRVPGFLWSGSLVTGGSVPDIELSPFATQTAGYAVLFSAYLIVPSPGGVYQFDVTSADGSVLWIGAEKVVDNDGQHGPQTLSGTVNLAPGYHPFSLGYFFASNGPQLGVNWSQPGISQPVAIPGSAFVQPPEYLDAATDAPTNPAPGLYWYAYTDVVDAISNNNCLPRIDSDCVPCAAGISIDANVPDVGAPGDFFVRWTGLIDVPTDGSHSFSLDSDDGARLWVDGLLAVDDDGMHSATTVTSTVALRKGLHRIQADYFQGGGNWTLQATWPAGTSLVRDPGGNP